jgi:O-antigen ligase
MWDIILNSPFFGYGYGSIKTSDFSLYEVISLGGLIGVLVYLFLFIMLLFINAKIKDRAIRHYYFYILIITILTSMSAPVITANRVSVVFWILTSFIVMLYAMQFKKSKRVV